jgi:hypothetical protein
MIGCGRVWRKNSYSLSEGRAFRFGTFSGAFQKGKKDNRGSITINRATCQCRIFRFPFFFFSICELGAVSPLQLFIHSTTGHFFFKTIESLGKLINRSSIRDNRSSRIPSPTDDSSRARENTPLSSQTTFHTHIDHG